MISKLALISGVSSQKPLLKILRHKDMTAPILPATTFKTTSSSLFSSNPIYHQAPKALCSSLPLSDRKSIYWSLCVCCNVRVLVRPKILQLSVFLFLISKKKKMTRNVGILLNNWTTEVLKIITIKEYTVQNSQSQNETVSYQDKKS